MSNFQYLPTRKESIELYIYFTKKICRQSAEVSHWTHFNYLYIAKEHKIELGKYPRSPREQTDSHVQRQSRAPLHSLAHGSTTLWRVAALNANNFGCRSDSYSFLVFNDNHRVINIKQNSIDFCN